MSTRRPILPPPIPRSENASKEKPKSDLTSAIIQPLKELSVNAATNKQQVGDKALIAKGLTVQHKSTGVKNTRKRLSPQDLESLSARQHSRLIEQQHSAYLEHPYALKLEAKKSKLLKVMADIFALANNDLIVCDFDTGLNDYSKNLKFADDLDNISKELIVLSKECSDKAVIIRDRIDQAKEDKRLIQDVVFDAEILKESEKCEEIRLVRPDLNYVPKDFVPKTAFRVKRERTVTLYVDTTDSETEKEPQKKKNKKTPPPPSGDPDTKFKFTKTNDFDELRHPNSICVLCDKVFRDQHELRNHMSNHHKELFRCLKCGNLSRTEVSFNQHMKTHNGERFTCSVCLMVFDRKSTLSNHEQKHSKDKLVCKKCAKEFQYRGGFLEHIKYRHTEKPTVPCPICKKFFWTPTGMRSHRVKKHGRVRELVYQQ